MTDKTKKKKKVWQKYIAIICFMLMGAVCGFLMVTYIDKAFDGEMSVYEEILHLCGLLIGMYAAIFIQIIIHEAGHLVFGLLSGYKFSSFRIFSFMWIKEKGKIRLKRHSVAGTGGQCLMSPPEFVNGKMPVVLYNLGGSLMNIIAGLIFLGLFFVFSDMPFVSVLFLLLAVIGFIFALMNGVPMRTGTVDNDGYNAFSLTGNSDAMRAFWLQMKISEQVSKGVRLRDMPEEWFTVPDDEAMKNSMVAAVGVFACNRLVDSQKYKEADILAAHLLEIESGMVGLHRNLLICDRIYYELISQNRPDIVDGMLTKEQKKFMKSMKKFPSVLRTEYAYVLLCKKDRAKAEKIKAQFEYLARTYPYPNDIQAERELFDLAEKKA